MARWRIVLGLVAGVLFVASAAAHSLLGWKALAAELAKVPVPPDLVRGLAIGWHFGGAAMLAFGVIVILLFLEARRNSAVSLRPALVIGIALHRLRRRGVLPRRLQPVLPRLHPPGPRTRRRLLEVGRAARRPVRGRLGPAPH